MSTRTAAERLPSSPAIRAMAACLQAKVFVLFEAPPGTGKTQTAEAFAASQSWDCLVQVGNSSEASDYKGMPYADEEAQTTRFLPLDSIKRLNAASHGALYVLDEFRNVDIEIMRPMHQVIHDRVVGEVALADHVRIVGFQNPLDQSTGGTEIPPGIANRTCHLTWKPDRDAWEAGMLGGFESVTYPKIEALAPYDPQRDLAIRSAIVEYTRTTAHEWNSVPSDEDLRAAGWPSSRSWHNLAKVLAHVRPYDELVMRDVTVGIVGASVAAGFLKWFADQDLIAPEDMIAKPKSIPWTKQTIDRTYVMSLSLVHYVLGSDDARLWERSMAVPCSALDAGRAEHGTLMARRLLSGMPSGARIPDEFRTKFGQLLVEQGVMTTADRAH